MNELVILAALLRAPDYGYGLKKSGGLISGGRVIHPNCLYPLLKKSVQNGWVEQSSIPGERGQPRKQYCITAAGKKYLLENLSTFAERDASDEASILFRVAFFDYLAKEKRRKILEGRRVFLESRADDLARLPEQIALESFGLIALDRARATIQDQLRWICELEDRI